MESTNAHASAGVLNRFKTILEMIKFEHTIFALPFAYMGMLLGVRSVGQSMPTLSQFVWITLAMVGARSFAMSLNRLIDREIDARNPRTAGRALPMGALTPDSVIVFTLGSALLFFVSTWMLAPLSRYVWPLVIAPFVIYSYTKRFTWLNHVVLGICLGFAPVGAWIGMTNGISSGVILLGVGVALWTAGFDIIYACQDLEVDRDEGLFSIPARFGVARALFITRAMHGVAVTLFAASGMLLGLGVVYYTGVAAVALLLLYENVIIRQDDFSRLDAAFFTMNSFVSVIIFAFTFAELILKSVGVMS